MISRSEIVKLAAEKRVRTSTIDKDWVLGHFIDALFSIPECREHLVFKGGTCLKKCRLPDYRFSEDLDFTSRSEAFVLDRAMMERVASLVTKRTEMPLHLQSVEPLLFNNRLVGYAARIKYWGADHSRSQQPTAPARWHTSVKLEVTLYEIACFEAELSAVHHPYSDRLTDSANSIPIYSVHEVLAEKVRALIQRSYTAPRDYYDIWYLSKHTEGIDWQLVAAAFHKKSAYKGLAFTGVEQLINPSNDRILKAAWKNSLEHQIATGELPDYDTVRRELLALFTKVFGG